MAELVKRKYSKRVLFNGGKQKKFIDSALQKSSLTIGNLAKCVGVHPRTIRDWRREKFSISFVALKRICETAKINFPKKVRIKNPFWYTSFGASNGGRALIAKYGRVPVNERYRKKKWYGWWKRKGRFMKHSLIGLAKSVVLPRPSRKLAEFVGIMLGDGGLTSNQLTITLNREDDLKYSKYVLRLIKELFHLTPRVIHRTNYKVLVIRVSRIRLVKYLNKLGLVIGNKIKQRIDIPPWIKQNLKYLTNCIRGLIDTDGSVIIHKYKSGGLNYIYKKLAFTSRSGPLLSSVRDFFEKKGWKCKIGNNFDVRIEACNNVKDYFKVVGSHNPKHLKRYLK